MKKYYSDINIMLKNESDKFSESGLMKVTRIKILKTDLEPMSCLKFKRFLKIPTFNLYLLKIN